LDCSAHGDQTTLDLTQRLLREASVVQEARVDAIARESQVASVT